MAVPRRKLEFLYFNKGGVPANSDSVVQFLTALDIAPDLPMIEAVVGDHCGRYKSSAGINQSVLPYHIVQELAQECKTQEIKKVRLGDDQHYFHDAWVASGGDDDFTGKVKVSAIAEVLKEVGMPDKCLEELKGTELGNPNAQVTYRAFINSIAIDDELVGLVSDASSIQDNDLVASAKRLTEERMGKDAARSAWPMIKALTLFKARVRKILEKKRGIQGEQSLSKSTKLGFLGLKNAAEPVEPTSPRRMKERIKANNSFRKPEPSPGTPGAGGPGGGPRSAGATQLAALVGFTRKVPNLKNLTPLSKIDDNYDRAVKQLDRDEAMQKRDDQQKKVDALARSHPHTAGLDLVKTYCHNPVEAPQSLVKAKKHREHKTMSPAERMFQKRVAVKQRRAFNSSSQQSVSPSPGGHSQQRSHTTPLLSYDSSAFPTKSSSKLPPLGTSGGQQQTSLALLSPGDLDFFTVEDRGTSTYNVPNNKWRGRGVGDPAAGVEASSPPTTTKVTKTWATVAIQVVPIRKKKPHQQQKQTNPDA